MWIIYSKLAFSLMEKKLLLLVMIKLLESGIRKHLKSKKIHRKMRKSIKKKI